MGNHPVNSWTGWLNWTATYPPCAAPKLSNKRQVRQRPLICCYSYRHGYVNFQTIFGSNYCGYSGGYSVFRGLIWPNITHKITQNIPKMWAEVYNNWVIALVQALIVVWPNHWHHCFGHIWVVLSLSHLTSELSYLWVIYLWLVLFLGSFIFRRSSLLLSYFCCLSLGWP